MCLICSLFALALSKVRRRLTRTRDLLKIDDRVVAEDLVLSIDVEVVAEAVLVHATDRRAPLLVAVVRAEIGHLLETSVTSKLERQLRLFLTITIIDWPDTPPAPCP